MGDLQFTFHGAAKEVGRSCIEVEGKSRFLLDAGLQILEDKEHPINYPTDINNYHDIDCIFISHAHLDHIGALPLLNHRGLNCPIYCSPLTKAFAKIMLEDSLKVELIEGCEPVYTKRNIRRVLRMMTPRKPDEITYHDDISFQLIPAGHIPGSSMIYLDIDGKKMIYTGDINDQDSELVKGMDVSGQFSKGFIDHLIMESTYGDRNHPDRESSIVDFIDVVKKTIHGGGSVVIPSFAMGRSQEILLLLKKYCPEIPVYLDGMGQKLLKIMLEFPDYLKDPEAMKSAFNTCNLVHGWKMRAEAVKERGIFVTTSGMLDGGPVLDYIRHLYFDSKSSVLLTGYQAEGTNGRQLLEKGKITLRSIEGKEETVDMQCNYQHFDFSAHAGMDGLINFAHGLAPKKVILQHGDPPSIKNMAEALKAMNPIVPELDAPFKV